MKWSSQDIHMYEKSKKYIDTIVIPLLPISFADDMKQSVEMGELIQLLTIQLEQQLKGRMMLMPGFTYLKSLHPKNNVSLLRQWEEQLLPHHFKHIFYVTSDSEWNNVEEQLAGKLIWLPSLALDEMDEQSKISLVGDQVKQLLNLFYQRWKEV